MFSTLKDWCQEYANESVQEKEEDAMKKETLLLDLCCGTGTIGQVISTAVDSVVGIDIVEQAIIDARRNAEINSE